MGAAVASFFVLLTGILGAYWWFVVREESHAQEAFWRRLKAVAPTGRVRSQLLKRAQQLSAVPSLLL